MAYSRSTATNPGKIQVWKTGIGVALLSESIGGHRHIDRYRALGRPVELDHDQRPHGVD